MKYILISLIYNILFTIIIYYHVIPMIIDNRVNDLDIAVIDNKKYKRARMTSRDLHYLKTGNINTYNK